ncbi:MAG: phenylalanine--tRNA ligase subunit beta [Nanoarchaeota archaeon]|nr:phenylalanine--tRNA ligase subunit beta [Nanoarchaeota archaeon]MBU4086350.1 phenylalanine--tRNA ligase subunit beta [Nanoarchaeota archaeon]
MASTKFPRKEFEKCIKLSEEVKDKISMLGTHLESSSEEEIELEILPNRPDLFSLQGFMRSFLPFINKSKKKEYKIKSSGMKIIVDKSVAGIRPFSMAAIVKNIKFTDEKIKDVMQWQEKIHATLGRNRKKIALGYYILDKIKFPIVYKAEEPEKIVFEPLEMPEKMNAIQILQRHPAGREFAKQLEGLDKFPVYYDSNNEVLSMPPIINSHSLGKITSETKDVLIECTGTSLETLKKVISMAVVDLIDCGGEAYSVEIDYKNKKESIDLKPEKMKISLENANKLLGTNIKEAELKKLLEKMGYEYSNKHVLIPCYRTDIMHEVDIIEDIAIAYGYDNFSPEIPEVATAGKESYSGVLKRKISEILSGLGMLETSSFHLVSKDDLKKSGIKEAIEVEDSKTEYRFLRQDMLLPNLRVLASNIDSEYPQKIFEIGPVFKNDEKQETKISEPNHLAVSIAPGNFTEIKQVLEYLGRMLGKEFKIEEASHKSFIEGRQVKIIHNNQEIGILGEISPQILKNWKIKMPVSSLEININEIMA